MSENTKKVGDSTPMSEIIKEMVSCEANKNSRKPLMSDEIRAALELFKMAVIKEVEQGHRIQMTGFLTFAPVYRAPRKGNNIATRSVINIPEGIQITVKPGSLLRDAIKQLGPEAVQEFRNRNHS